MHRVGRFFGLSKQDTGKDDTPLEEAQPQEEADAAEPSTDLASITGPLVVSLDFAKDITSESPDRSAEAIASDVNEMALRDVPKSPPKAPVSGKRKRQKSDVKEKSPMKVAKVDGATRNGDQAPVTSGNGTTGHKNGSNRASLEAEKVAPGKLPRPKQTQRHMIKIYPQGAQSGDEYDFPLSPGKQVEKPAPTSHTATINPSSKSVTPRGRGRPRVGAPAAKKTSSIQPGPKALPKADVNLADDKKESTRTSRNTRSTAAAKVSKGINSNSNTKVKTLHVKSTQMDEGDEGQAEDVEDDPDVEDLTKADEINEEENEDEELELFGQDKAWKIVLDGARSVCDEELPLIQMPKRLKGRIKDLIYEVNEARSLYEQLLPFKGLSHDGLDGLNDDLTKSFDAIEDQIKKLSERNAAGKASEIIEHLFTCAIPAMVFLLQSALASRVYHSDEPCALESLNETVYGLSEIVRLQKMTILLCEKATNWKAKPDPSIKSPTTRKILPCLREMREVFSNVLSGQDRKRKMRQNALDYRLRQRTLTESPQQAKQEAARKDEIWQIKIRKSREQEDQNRRDEKRTLRQVREDEMRARMGSVGVNGHVESKTIWSDAEDLALYFQLEKGYAGHLTCTFIQSHLLCQCFSLIIFAAAERYLNILNTPLLQNKLPEHIRDRALYFKPTLLEQRGALEWISSID